jgi:uncharacterized protein YecA (UPF0149 family)
LELLFRGDNYPAIGGTKENMLIFEDAKRMNQQIKSRADHAVKGKLEPKQKRKVGRNASCPCGSGKKYKRCHGL